jgi:shikimate kinase
MRRRFVDIDDEIVRLTGMECLEDVRTLLGDDRFIELEGAIALLVLMTLKEPAVIATGGSIVYSETAMSWLKERGFIVYLEVSRATIERRLAKRLLRGIVWRGLTLEQLLAERIPLYLDAKELTIDANRPLCEATDELEEYLFEPALAA